jgi:glycosyltransferase involved in cell wall biosynthesis
MTLHGEDAYLDALPEPFRDQAWSELGKRMEHVDALIAVSRYYGDVMGERLSLSADQVHVVHNGIPLDGVEPRAETSEKVRAIGYLARMCPDKGLHTLVDAFIELGTRGHDELRLEIAGVMLKPDRAYVREQKDKLSRAGLIERTSFDANVSRERKLAFLRNLDILSVPAGYGEAFGLYVLEALAHSVPVVQPRHAAFPEIIERTGGGLLCEPDDPNSLADAIEKLVADPGLAGRLGAEGRRAVIEGLTDDHMARGVADILHRLTGTPSPSPKSLEAASA